MSEFIRKSLKWSVGIAVTTFVLAAIFSIISTISLRGVAWGIGMIIVLIIVLIGIVFDMLGIAATAANEVPFHAMASKKVDGARQAINIVRNADRFASFCNDVIGDISGIISGTAAAFVIVQLMTELQLPGESTIQFVASVLFTSVIAALTVGGKALGKSLALEYSTNIIFFVGKTFYLLESNYNITIMKEKKVKK
ncbi:hypothetical protein EJF36_13395 [Bacillus sp. HMF5848]|uniref:hypothetical protein n=1 Tax=Bacillus sp. HMF5848 TaxID=2495421 RepID=UPI000F766C49|nr:hypothetical protein [Bacillus sp. HMF5848]RSK27790.1 hypothetical protein EJF36_13395 [Bacillus sp. HMF5848]